VPLPRERLGRMTTSSVAQAILSLVDEDFARARLMQYGMKRLEELRKEGMPSNRAKTSQPASSLDGL
jgi:hypothetical protein